MKRREFMQGSAALAGYSSIPFTSILGIKGVSAEQLSALGDSSGEASGEQSQEAAEWTQDISHKEERFFESVKDTSSINYRIENRNIFITPAGEFIASREHGISSRASWDPAVEDLPETQISNGLYYLPMAIASNSYGQFYVIYESGKGAIVFDTNRLKIGELRVPEDYGFLSGIAIDGDDNIYLADSGKHRIYMFSPGGELIRIIGKFGMGNKGLNGPSELTVDSQNRLHILDKGNRHIKVFNRQGELVYQYGQTRLGKERSFNDILAIEDDLFVSDPVNNRVWVFNLQGKLSASFAPRDHLLKRRTPKRLSVDSQNLLHIHL
ncbi:NHL repeat-containing protein [Motilimonas eburnea]|uniref:NHL repeat-containing protein n=1 Tax=Motilimonas eburnea TaxID=1737488 RepID=UPI001E53BDF5|nr:NHL repeat-containing protein [Motilimonas eburnea]MCE2571200.1 NHL repeat-containing protein [Motilimonas eburnea]